MNDISWRDIHKIMYNSAGLSIEQSKEILEKLIPKIQHKLVCDWLQRYYIDYEVRIINGKVLIAMICQLANKEEIIGDIVLTSSSCNFLLRNSEEEFIRDPYRGKSLSGTVKFMEQIKDTIQLIRINLSCFGCSKISTTLLTCKRCLSARFCGQECLKAGWDEHKYWCKKWCDRRLTTDYEKVSQRKYPNLLPLSELRTIWKIIPPDNSREYWKLSKKIIYDQSSLIELPKDILNMIMRKYLDPCSRAICREVCKTLKSVFGVYNRRRCSELITRIALKYDVVFVLERIRQTLGTNSTDRWIWCENLTKIAVLGDSASVITWMIAHKFVCDEPIMTFQSAYDNFNNKLEYVLYIAINRESVRVVELVVRTFLLPKHYTQGRKHQDYLNQARHIMTVAIETNKLRVVKLLVSLGYKISKRRFNNIGKLSQQMKVYLRDYYIREYPKANMRRVFW